MLPVDGGPADPAELAHGGAIMLRTPARRFTFLAGLVGAVALGLLLPLLMQVHATDFCNARPRLFVPRP
jgi:hypothetical protein